MQQPAVQDPVVCLMGPTGTGKTEMALRLADRYSLDLISVDSALVYRGMDIGTAKPTAEVLARWPHRLVDIRDPVESYSAGEFRRDALAAIKEITTAGRKPLLVGGTLLYFRALIDGLASLPEPAPALRARLDAEAAEQGWAALHERLARVDPLTAARVDARDGQRIQRALEVYEQTGRPLSEHQAGAPVPTAPAHRYLKIGLVPRNRQQLNKNLEKRFNEMINNGLLDEVRTLYERDDLKADQPAMRAVGYRQLCQHLAGECDFEEACRRAVVATRRLAKRQMTWLRGEALDVRIDPFSAAPDTQVIDFLDPILCRRQEAL